MKRRLQLFPRERGRVDMNRINQPDKNLCKCQKNHTEGSVKVMVRYSWENIPQNAGAHRETTDPDRGSSYLMPGVRCGGCSAMSLCTCSLEGRIRAKRSVRAALNGTAPPMARRVLGERPNNQARTSAVLQFYMPNLPNSSQHPPMRKVLPRAPGTKDKL